MQIDLHESFFYICSEYEYTPFLLTNKLPENKLYHRGYVILIETLKRHKI